MLWKRFVNTGSLRPLRALAKKLESRQLPQVCLIHSCAMRYPRVALGDRVQELMITALVSLGLCEIVMCLLQLQESSETAIFGKQQFFRERYGSSSSGCSGGRIRSVTGHRGTSN